MDAQRKLSKEAERERAEKFYGQALLLVDCCKIPEAITLLEQAIKLDPRSELYKETLQFFHSSSQAYSDNLPRGQQELSYASVTKTKPIQSREKENTPPNKWKTKNSMIQENGNKNGSFPAASTTCFSDSYNHSSIDQPWASYMRRNSKRKKSPCGPIDSLSEIEIPQINGICYAQGPNGEVEDKVNQGEPIVINSPYSRIGSHQTMPKVERPGVPVDMPADHSNASDSFLHSFAGSTKYMPEAGRPVVFAQDNHVGASDGLNHSTTTDDVMEDETNRKNRAESLEARFVEDLCAERESLTDEWSKYYDVLCDGLNVADSDHSDTVRHTTLSDCDSTDNVEEISESEDLRGKGHFVRNHQRSDSIPSTSSENVCPKCGHLQTNGNSPPTPTKTRIHFVKGACVSSSISPNCTCSQQGKDSSKEPAVKSPLSPSQQDFYRNLRHYFNAGGKVKSSKTVPHTENSDISRGQRGSQQNSADTSSGTVTHESSQTKENIRQTTQCDKENDPKKRRKRLNEEQKNDKEVKVDNVCKDSSYRKSSFNDSEGENDRKPHRHERIRPSGKQPKSRTRDKDGSKAKVSSKNEHVNNVKQNASHSYTSERKKPGNEDKTKMDSKVKPEPIPRPEQVSEAKEKPRKRPKMKRTSLAEIDFNAVFTTLYLSGVTVLSKCWDILKSILYYTFLLLVLILGFLLYCIWCTSYWSVRKVVYYTALDKLLTVLGSQISTLFEWIKSFRRSKKKASTCTQGQTYDLPKNGDAAITHMLQNKDNDPYSVLGVPSDASDDDIRKQYRKLAMLIHPDKNPHSRADEAFKILANAFDILSDPEKRSDYDRETAWKRSEEERMENFGRTGSPEQFFADLERKMQEMQNYLSCVGCDGKHRRYSTDRFILTARYCSRCNSRHAAKEGDLWAESSFLGYKLHFYACMEGEIYDVTEWAKCQGVGNYRLEANPHTVHLKLKTRQSHNGGFAPRSDDEDLENFFRQFFGQFNHPRDERSNGSQKHAKPRKRKKKR